MKDHNRAESKELTRERMALALCFRSLIILNSLFSVSPTSDDSYLLILYVSYLAKFFSLVSPSSPTSVNLLSWSSVLAISDDSLLDSPCRLPL